jgi:hypothetical protein
VPIVQIVGEKGTLWINESDLEMWRDKGYKLKAETEALPQEPQKSDPVTPESRKRGRPRSSKVNFQRFTILQLRRFAEDARIRGFNNMDKKTISDALARAGYVPSLEMLDGDTGR